jgi:hypothetical protein
VQSGIAEGESISLQNFQWCPNFTFLGSFASFAESLANFAV